ncbi:MAG: sulfatase family protein [Planctomycetota bacterium]
MPGTDRRKIRRRQFLKLLGAGAAASVWTSLAPVADSRAGASQAKPNVIVILTDDIGYGDLACYGNRFTKTPTLDRFAREGVKFTHCYAASPNCSPARAGLLTGRMPYRAGMYDIMGAASPRTLRESEITIAELLKRVGYDTFHAGKWHLSHARKEGKDAPLKHGFDETVSPQGSAGSATHLVRALTQWLDNRRNRNKPFFAYLAPHETHENVALWAHEGYRRKFGADAARKAAAEMPYGYVPKYGKNSRVGDPRVYYGALAQLDDAFGNLLRYLERNNLRDNTFLFFTSDNGPEHRARYSFGSPGPLRGAKGHLHEGGIRVPGLLQWPGRTKAGTVVDEPVNGTDVFATVCAVAGAKIPTDRVIDGGNFLPALENRPVERQRPLFWAMWFGRGGYSYALREGDWKILAGTGPVPDGTEIIDFIRNPKFVRWQLVNLKEDPTETRDFRQHEPERFEKMKEELIALHKEIVAEGPYWSVEDHRGKNRYLWADKPSYPYTDTPFVGHHEP